MNNKKNYHEHKIVTKNIFFTILPAIIFPLIDIIPVFNTASKVVFVLIAIVFIGYQVIKLSLQEEKDNKKLQDELATSKKYLISQKILNSITETEKCKRNLLKTNSLPDYKKEVLLYYPHNYIGQICSNIKLLISNITDINLSSLSISFIYRYPTYNSKWQWITRKNSTINRELHEFILDDNSHSYFNYIITNNFSSHFEHNKENLIREGHYWISENDKRFSILGSIASYKMTYIKNETIFCLGYLVISTYGRTFVEDPDNQSEINKFNYLLSDIVIPSYRHLIETELGFMYERHNIIENSKSQ